MIDWSSFTPISSFLGGSIIGWAAFLLLLLHGRIMGVSGILSELTVHDDQNHWRIVFLLGSTTGPVFFTYVNGKSIEVVHVGNLITTMFGAFLIGLGTAIGSGCTSGHGICGLARFSLRSLTAVAIFISTAVVTVYFFQHWHV